jgi:hypothetical protein
MLIRKLLSQELCDRLYDPFESGVVVLPSVVDKNTVQGVLSELQENSRNFVQRQHSYGTTVQGLSSWDMELGVVNNYPYLSQMYTVYEQISTRLHNISSKNAVCDEISINSSFYPQGSVGIGPHRDNTFSVNFVIIFVFSGTNDFYTSIDKDRSEEKCHTIRPGDCIIMRGPRDISEKCMRPIHYVKDILEDRYIVTFREINHELLSRVPKKAIYNI